jgi:translation initiation factor 4E
VAFARLYNNIVPPSQLPQKANYYLFKVRLCVLLVMAASHVIQEGIIPAWEDDANKSGGKWSIQLPREKNRGNVDKMWLYTVSEKLTDIMRHRLDEVWWHRCWQPLAKRSIRI